jgi:hypothetical protein
MEKAMQIVDPIKHHPLLVSKRKGGIIHAQLGSHHMQLLLYILWYGGISTFEFLVGTLDSALKISVKYSSFASTFITFFPNQRSNNADIVSLVWLRNVPE